MINIVTPPRKFTVVEYKHQALRIIQQLHTQNKLPIVVGGTNYYIEALLWDFLVGRESLADLNEDEKDQTATMDEKEEVQTEEADESGARAVDEERNSDSGQNRAEVCVIRLVFLSIRPWVSIGKERYPCGSLELTYT